MSPMGNAWAELDVRGPVSAAIATIMKTNPSPQAVNSRWTCLAETILPAAGSEFDKKPIELRHLRTVGCWPKRRPTRTLQPLSL
jgi:hypothetical protein